MRIWCRNIIKERNQNMYTMKQLKQGIAEHFFVLIIWNNLIEDQEPHYYRSPAKANKACFLSCVLKMDFKDSVIKMTEGP